MSNFFFCHYVFKRPSAAEASESVYMRERVNGVAEWLACWIKNQACGVRDPAQCHGRIPLGKTHFLAKYCFRMQILWIRLLLSNMTEIQMKTRSNPN